MSDRNKKWDPAGVHLTRDDLIAYFTGAAPHREMEIEEHIAGCAQCTETARGVRRTVGAVRSATAQAYHEALARDLPETVRDALNAAALNPKNLAVKELLKRRLALGMEAIQAIAGIARTKGTAVLRPLTPKEVMPWGSALQLQPAMRDQEVQNLTLTGKAEQSIIVVKDHMISVRMPADVLPNGGLIALIPLSNPQETTVRLFERKGEDQDWTATLEAEADDRYLLVLSEGAAR